jgi:hypothetical protein
VSLGLLAKLVMEAFWDEIKTHPNIPYRPLGLGSYEVIPAAYR